jgi:hypothetical protein
MAIKTFNIKNKKTNNEILIVNISVNRFKGYLSNPSTWPNKRSSNLGVEI